MAFLNNAGVERLWAHILSRLNRKVDKVEGKGLSTEDFTTEEKEKLAAIGVGTGESVQADWAQTDETQSDFIKNKPDVLPLTGGTLSGDLYANGFYVNSPSIYPSVTFSGTVDEELEKFGMVEFHENHRGSIVSEMQDGSYKEYYQFPRPADTGTENAYYDVLTTKNPSESLAKLGGLPLTGGTLSGDLKLTSGTNQRKINIYRNIGDSQYELQHSINYEGKGFLGVYKNSKEVNMIKLGENSTEFSKPITVSGGATGDVAARTRENLGIPTDEHINELISAALASFTNGEEVSY